MPLDSAARACLRAPISYVSAFLLSAIAVSTANAQLPNGRFEPAPPDGVPRHVRQETILARIDGLIIDTERPWERMMIQGPDRTTFSGFENLLDYFVVNSANGLFAYVLDGRDNSTAYLVELDLITGRSFRIAVFDGPLGCFAHVTYSTSILLQTGCNDFLQYIPGSRQAPDVPAPMIASATTELFLRAGPKTYFDVLITIPPASQVSVRFCATLDTVWCQVEWQGRAGWASGAHLNSGGEILAQREAPEYHQARFVDYDRARSPDGKYEVIGYTVDPATNLIIRDIRLGTETVVLSAASDYSWSIGHIIWSADSQSVYFDDTGGLGCIWRYDVLHRTLDLIVPEHEAQWPWPFSYEGVEYVLYSESIEGASFLRVARRPVS